MNGGFWNRLMQFDTLRKLTKLTGSGEQKTDWFLSHFSTFLLFLK